MKILIIIPLVLLSFISLPSWSEDFDIAAAIKQWTHFAEKGNAEAQSNLGIAYYDGYGVPEDKKTAAKWFKLAAKQGNVDAQYNLGVMYFIGGGVARDKNLSYMWLSLAAASGHKNAKENKELILKKMTSSEVDSAEKFTRKCIAKDFEGC